MVLEGEGASRARVAAMVSTGLGLMAMVFAPLARSAGPANDAGAPTYPPLFRRHRPAARHKYRARRRSRRADDAEGAFLDRRRRLRKGLRLPAAERLRLAQARDRAAPRPLRASAKRVRSLRGRLDFARLARLPARRGRVRRRNALATPRARRRPRRRGERRGAPAAARGRRPGRGRARARRLLARRDRRRADRPGLRARQVRRARRHRVPGAP